MEKISPTKYFQLRKEFEDETGLKIRDNKDAYIRWLETKVFGLGDKVSDLDNLVLELGEERE